MDMYMSTNSVAINEKANIMNSIKDSNISMLESNYELLLFLFKIIHSLNFVFVPFKTKFIPYIPRLAFYQLRISLIGDLAREL